MTDLARKPKLKSRVPLNSTFALRVSLRLDSYK